MMFGTFGAVFYVYDLPGLYNADTVDWGMYRHDPQCSGLALDAPDDVITSNNTQYATSNVKVSGSGDGGGEE